MLYPSYTTRFDKDLKKVRKRGKDEEKLKNVMRKLINEEPLEAYYRNHPLKGRKYKGVYELHIEPNWLLIYLIDGDKIIFQRTGTHPDLFG